MQKKNKSTSAAPKPAIRTKSKVRAGINPPPAGWENHNQTLVVDR